jgi:hypothetical protein
MLRFLLFTSTWPNSIKNGDALGLFHLRSLIALGNSAQDALLLDQVIKVEAYL